MEKQLKGARSEELGVRKKKEGEKEENVTRVAPLALST
jgi:hypothetical protein